MASNLSNEKIIELLTKDLEKVKVERTEDENSESTSLPSDRERTKHDDIEEMNSGTDSTSNHDTLLTKDEDNCAAEADISEVERIDEATLQNRDALLSNGEKENFLREALEHKAKGNEQFKGGEYFYSVISYSNGLKICPLIYTKDRSILYANRAASKHKLERKESAVQDCSKALELDTSYLKAYLRRAILYEELDKLDEALEDYKKISELDPGNEKALVAMQRLPSQINERNEKLKAEMLDKLKDLGNMVLRPFGLSTNNFKMTKDPSSGGYSINFVQNS